VKRGADEVGLLLIDGYDVLGVTTQIEDNLEALLQETMPFGASWAEQAFTGLKKASLSQEGFYDDASNSSNTALSGQQGINRLLCYGIQGNVIGQHFIGYSGAMQVNYSRIAARGEIHRANASYEGSGEVEEGLILHHHVARTADGDTEDTPVDNGAASADGGSAYLQVSALTLDGYDNIVIKIRQSADGEVWEDLTSFTAITVAPAKERKVLTGAVKQYLAVSWAFTGTGSDPSVKFFVGFKRN